jgi:hypothetical protein
MTPTDTVALVRLVAELWPAMKLGEYTADAWHDVLADLPPAVALAAVRRLARTRRGFIGPADIRAEAYRAADALAPDPDQVFAAISRVAAADGIGRTELHPLAQQAYAALGGAPGLSAAPRWAARRDFDAAWQRIADTHDTTVLAADYPTVIRQELT